MALELTYLGLTLVNTWVAGHLQNHLEGIREFLSERQGP